jgi:TM2 domain-containing membrane protein YozV
MAVGPLKKCPLCGETILSVALRCKHCQADLGQRVSAPAPAERETPESAAEGFERRFLEFAYNTTAPINPPAVAYALKVSIAEATDQLEDLAARDVLVRDVDDEGRVAFHLPGRMAHLHAMGRQIPPSQALVPRGLGDAMQTAAPTPNEGQAVAALLLNVLLLPGVGSLVGGQTSAGVAQLMMCLIGIPLCFIVVGIPLVFASWVWALVTGVQLVTAARQSHSQHLL